MDSLQWWPTQPSSPPSSSSSSPLFRPSLSQYPSASSWGEIPPDHFTSITFDVKFHNSYFTFHSCPRGWFYFAPDLSVWSFPSAPWDTFVIELSHQCWHTLICCLWIRLETGNSILWIVWMPRPLFLCFYSTIKKMNNYCRDSGQKSCQHYSIESCHLLVLNPHSTPFTHRSTSCFLVGFPRSKVHRNQQVPPPPLKFFHIPPSPPKHSFPPLRARELGAIIIIKNENIYIYIYIYT